MATDSLKLKQVWFQLIVKISKKATRFGFKNSKHILIKINSNNIF